MKNHARRPRLFNGLAWFFEPVDPTILPLETDLFGCTWSFRGRHREPFSESRIR